MKPVLVSSQKAVLDPMIAHVMGACVEHPALARDEFIGPRLQALVSGDCVFLLAAIHQHGDGFASNIDAGRGDSLDQGDHGPIVQWLSATWRKDETTLAGQLRGAKLDRNSLPVQRLV